VCVSQAANAQYSYTEAYFSAEELPNPLKWLPAPPDTTSAAFMYDLSQYMWGKEQRHDPERAEIAIRDAVFGVQTIIDEFSEPFGLQISQEETPEIYKVLAEGTMTCVNICAIPKYHYMRKRPFDRLKETSLTPDDEAHLQRSGSYPSGHTILGWSAALLLMEINPDRADTLLARGYMYGESRVIVGVHWRSDVEAGRLVASVAYARLHTSERFLEQMKKARAEFKQKMAELQDIEVIPSDSIIAGDAREYTLSGTKATPSSRGIIVSKNRKTVRR